MMCKHAYCDIHCIKCGEQATTHALIQFKYPLTDTQRMGTGSAPSPGRTFDVGKHITYSIHPASRNQLQSPTSFVCGPDNFFSLCSPAHSRTPKIQLQRTELIECPSVCFRTGVRASECVRHVGTCVCVYVCVSVCACVCVRVCGFWSFGRAPLEYATTAVLYFLYISNYFASQLQC